MVVLHDYKNKRRHISLGAVERRKGSKAISKGGDITLKLEQDTEHTKPRNKVGGRGEGGVCGAKKYELVIK